MEGFDLVSEAKVLGIAVHFWRSKSTGQALLIAQAPTATINVAIVLPTKAETSEGEAHCLEHLIFRGSKKFPIAGFIDSLASKSLSPGTNAFTCTDRTVYTLSVAGDQGLCQILPVYLDHVHHPSFSANDFATEVYRVDALGDDTGVVFSEMEADASDPESLASVALHRLAYEESCSYHHQTGGNPAEIPNLSIDKIRAMHEKYYKPCNTVIIIVGNVNLEKVGNCIREYEAKLLCPEERIPRPFSSPWSSLREAPRLPKIFSASETWPSDLEEGLCALAFRIGCWTDCQERIAVDVLATYLAEGPAAPLNEFIIETQDKPLASAVSYVIEDYRWPLTAFYFEDAILDSIETIKPRFLEIVSSLIHNGEQCQLDQNRLSSIVHKKIWEEYSTLEQCQLDFRLSSWIINSTEEDLVRENSLRDAMCHDAVYESLLGRPLEWWQSLLDKYFSGHEERAPCYEVLVRPSATMSDVAETRKKRLREARVAKHMIPQQPTSDDHKRKAELAKLLEEHGRAILDVKGVDLVYGKVFVHETDWECKKDLDKLANPIHLVDMKIERDSGLFFESQFVDLSILVPIPKDWETRKLWSHLTSGGKRSLLKNYDPDIRSFISDLSRTDMEKQYQTKQALVMKEASDLGNDEVEGSEFESGSEGEEILEEFCEQSLWFVLSHCTCLQMVNLISHCLFNSHLAMPRAVAKRLALSWTETQGDLVLIEPSELNKKLTSIALEFDADQGLESSAIFSTLLHINWKTHLSTFAESLPLLRAVIEYTDVSLERLLVAAKKDLTQYNSMIRAGAPILSSISHLTKYKFESSVNAKNLMVQSILARVILKYPEVFQPIVDSLMDELREAVCSPRAMLHVAADASKFCRNFISPLLHNFKSWAATKETVPEKQQPTTIKPYQQQKLDKLPTTLTINNLHTVSLESGHLHVTTPLPAVLVSKFAGDGPFALYADGACLLVVLEFLRGIEGPVFQPVRDSGTCYGPSFRICLDQWTQTLSLTECTKPHEALSCAMQSLRDLHHSCQKALAQERGEEGEALAKKTPEEEEDSNINLALFHQAKSAALHEAVDELATPADAADAFLDCWLRHIDEYNDVLVLKKIEAVTWWEFLNTLNELLSAFLDLDDGHEKLITSVGPKDKSELVRGVIGDNVGGEVATEGLRKRLVEVLVTAVGENAGEKPFLRLSLETLLAAQTSSLCDELCDDDEDDEDEEDDASDS